MRSVFICLLFNLFTSLTSKGQNSASTPAGNPGVFHDTRRVSLVAPSTSGINRNLNGFSSTSVKTMPSTFYYNSIGFFCKKELQIEKTLRFPLKFRLGSVAYTDKMEGKSSSNTRSNWGN
jgi:hypothetical protein